MQMKKIFLAWIALIIIAWFVLEPAGSEGAVRKRMVDYGSGVIGDWQSMSHSQSSSTDFFAALGDSNGFYFVGDSIANGSKDKIKTMLANHGDASGYNVWSGRPTAPAIDWVLAARDASGLPKNILMISGSNDIFDPVAFKPQVDRLMSIVGSSRNVYWVVPNVSRPSYQYPDQRNSGLISTYLHQAECKYTNLYLIEWGQFLAEKPTRIAAYTPDGVHPDSDDGQAVLVALIESRIYTP